MAQNRRPLATLVRNRLYRVAIEGRRWYLRKVWKIEIGDGTRISFTAKLDRTYPEGVVIGSNSAVAFGAAVLSHDFIYSKHKTTTIGDNTFIGARSIIMPGVTVGSGCIVSANSVVHRDVPDGSVVLGNPARIVEKDIRVGKFGNRVEVDDTDASEAE